MSESTLGAVLAQEGQGKTAARAWASSDRQSWARADEDAVGPELEEGGDACGLEGADAVEEAHGVADVADPVARARRARRRWRAGR